MPYSPDRQYHSVHFPEYLDNGSPDIPPYPSFGNPGAIVDHNNWSDFVQESKGRQTATAKSIGSWKKNYFFNEVSRLCKEQLGVGALTLDYPGGTYRSSFRITLENGQSVIASRRPFQGRAQLEALVLDRLYSHNADVPAPFAFNGLVLIQEDLGDTRLAGARGLEASHGYTRLLSSALQGLHQLHVTAEKIGLDQLVQPMGQHTDWLIALLDRSMVIGSYLGIPSPTVPVESLFDLLTVVRPRFIKWDARPGNAIIRSDETIAWFDWEHCCARNHLDDMAWLLCDETLPDQMSADEDHLIEKHLSLFADGRSEAEAHEYLRVFGVFHFCTRLGRLLDTKGPGQWSDADSHFGKPQGSSLASSLRLTRRGARWAERSDSLRPLSSWFNDITERLPGL